MKIEPKIELFNMDCMEAMKQMPDKAFDLAIVDPPYGINVGGVVGGANRSVMIGGRGLSSPKVIGGSTTVGPRRKNTSSC